MNRFRCFFYFCLLMLAGLTACMGVKPGTQKGGKHLYEAFFVGEEGTQYFIKPLAFGSAEKNELLLDVTFRQADGKAGMAEVKFSVLSATLLKAADSIVISNGSVTKTATGLTKLFSERTKTGFVNRFTGNMPVAEVKQLFDNSAWLVTVYSNKQKLTFTSPKNTRKKIGTLNHNIFTLF